MALFRFHRGSLKESLLTTVVVKSKNELAETINNNLKGWAITSRDLTIKRYPEERMGSNFDERIGWYTHIVIEEGHGVHGFLSEALDE